MRSALCHAFSMRFRVNLGAIKDQASTTDCIFHLLFVKVLPHGFCTELAIITQAAKFDCEVGLAQPDNVCVVS